MQVEWHNSRAERNREYYWRDAKPRDMQSLLFLSSTTTPTLVQTDNWLQVLDIWTKFGMFSEPPPNPQLYRSLRRYMFHLIAHITSLEAQVAGFKARGFVSAP